MKHVLDSDTMLALLTTPAPGLRAMLSKLSEQPCISAVTAGELLCLAERSSARLKAGLTRALELFEVLPYGLDEASVFATLSCQPEVIAAGLRTEQVQVLAQAIAADAFLVSSSPAMRARMSTASADWTRPAA